MIRIGICGWGFMGRTHAANLCRHPDVRVVAIADADPSRLLTTPQGHIGNLSGGPEVAVDLHAVTRTESVETLIAGPTIDFLVVTVPTPLHPEISIAALNAGKHVFCEKPMALSSAACGQMIEAAERSTGQLMIGHCVRFWPQYAEIRRRVASGMYGSIRSVVLRRVCAPPSYSRGGWLLDHRQSGGALFDLHVHDADYALYLMGEPASITALGTIGPSGGIDHVMSLWEYGDGRIASLEGGWCHHGGYPFEMYVNVRCERATLEWSSNAGAAVKLFRDDAEPEKIAVAKSDGWREEMAYFLDCIREGRAAETVTPESSAQAIRMIELERESIERGGVKRDFAR